jgi:LmbE family N-acetylglucosaminyl deacetylase
MTRVANQALLSLLLCISLTRCRAHLPQEGGASQRAPVLLAIFAHPDDEAVVAAVLAKYAAAGVRVYLATATDGRLGGAAHAGVPLGDQLAAVRADELKCAAAKLGLQPPIRFGLHDQLRMTEGLTPYGSQVQELRDRVKRIFEELQPDAVITWGPSGWTGHPDHRMVSAVVTEVFQTRQWGRPSQVYYPALRTGSLPPFNLLPTATVDPSYLPIRIAVTQRDYETAKAALLCHQSQFTAEQIEQIYASLVASQQGTAHFQPLVPERAVADSLLPPHTRRGAGAM